MLSAESPAKINLTLRVGPIRADGFHPVESLVAQIDLCDRIEIHPSADGDWVLTCSDRSIPVDSTNLALRAVRALQQAFPGERAGGRIHIEKRIPAGGGLGGGSSNAAATLRLLNQHWQLGLDDSQFATVGATLGSDVPLFLHSSPCVMRGRGEQIAPASLPIPGWVTLVLPGLACATREVYAAFDRLPAPPIRPDVDVLAKSPNDADAFMRSLFNDLEPAAFAVAPRLGELFKRIDSLAPGLLRMTGSGSTFFRLIDTEIDAQRFAELVKRTVGVRCEAVRMRVE